LGNDTGTPAGPTRPRARSGSGLTRPGQIPALQSLDYGSSSRQN
jgi:hypothetical protein